MPMRPKHPCNYPGCGRLTDKRYCEEHTKLQNKKYEKYQRDPESRSWYGRKWQSIRNRYIKLHPVCEECYRKGIIVPAEEVHHLKPLREGGTHEGGNLVSLCKICHSKIHVERGDRW